MKVQTIDAKRRLVLPNATPGEFYAVNETSPGRYELIKVIPAPCKKPKPEPSQLDALLASGGLTPKMNSAQLRSLTREP